eukprot:tig00000571_g2173.t1
MDFDEHVGIVGRECAQEEPELAAVLHRPDAAIHQLKPDRRPNLRFPAAAAEALAQRLVLAPLDTNIPFELAYQGRAGQPMPGQLQHFPPQYAQIQAPSPAFFRPAAPFDAHEPRWEPVGFRMTARGPQAADREMPPGICMLLEAHALSVGFALQCSL